MEKNGPTCFDPDSVSGIRLNIIFKEFKRFFNMTETLGRRLIDDCPTMVQYEVQLMQELAGSNR